MKVVAFNGSSRKDGNTGILLTTVLGELTRKGIETKLDPNGRETATGLHRMFQVL